MCIRDSLNLETAEFSALIFSEKNATIHTHGQSVSEQFWSIPEAGETFALSHLKTINRCDLYIFQRSNLSWTKVAFYFFHLRERNDIKRKITEASRKHGSNKRTIFDPSVETALRDVFVVVVGIDYISRESVRLIQCDGYYARALIGSCSWPIRVHTDTWMRSKGNLFSLLYHVLKSSVICYWTEARQNGTFLLRRS